MYSLDFADCNIFLHPPLLTHSGRVVRLVNPVLNGCLAGAIGAAAVAAAKPVVGGAHVAKQKQTEKKP